MKVTEHALKRLALLTMDMHARNEFHFIHRYLLPGTKTIQWNHGIRIDDIPLFASRCHNFGGQMLGLETWIDSPHALYTFAYEDFSEYYTSRWFELAITELKLVNVIDSIIPTVSFPEDVIELYMG